MSYPKVHIVEECMREGMQIESVEITVEQKVQLLDALSQTGLDSIVVGSFVSPKYTPQMAAIDAVMERFTPYPDVTYSAVALNDKGRERAAVFTPPLSKPSAPPALFCHLCDTFTRRNANMSQAQEIERWPRIIDAAVAKGATEAGIAVNAAWGSNFQGRFSQEQRMEMLRRQHALWDEVDIPVRRVMLGDPMGWCMPHVVEQQLQSILAEWPDIYYVHLHLHDARGMALASIYAALRTLDERHEFQIETTAGGVGGCPYCGTGRATGMAATEDVVNMLNEMGIETGVDLDRLIDAVWVLEEIIGRQTPGHVSKAGPMPHGHALFDANLPLVETHEEVRHFKLGPEACEHQIRPWREPIPEPAIPANA
jgi:hydroxymethylglutaryl-CoA lyase